MGTHREGERERIDARERGMIIEWDTGKRE
jgi:hypothetical protein